MQSIPGTSEAGQHWMTSGPMMFVWSGPAPWVDPPGPTPCWFMRYGPKESHLDPIGRLHRIHSNDGSQNRDLLRFPPPASYPPIEHHVDCSLMAMLGWIVVAASVRCMCETT